MSRKRALGQVDPQIEAALQREAKRLKNTINLIAAENYASPAVLEAQGSLFTNKYLAAEMWTRWRAWPLSAPRSFSGQSMPMSRLIAGLRPMPQPT
jgi:hypothetical protein